ncbi:unnamed protein product, partial [marine sediment metagenome]
HSYYYRRAISHDEAGAIESFNGYYGSNKFDFSIKKDYLITVLECNNSDFLKYLPKKSAAAKQLERLTAPRLFLISSANDESPKSYELRVLRQSKEGGTSYSLIYLGRNNKKNVIPINNMELIKKLTDIKSENFNDKQYKAQVAKIICGNLFELIPNAKHFIIAGEGLFNLYKYYFSLKETSKAINMLEKSAHLNYQEAVLEYGRHFNRNGTYDEAIKWCNKVTSEQHKARAKNELILIRDRMLTKWVYRSNRYESDEVHQAALMSQLHTFESKVSDDMAKSPLQVLAILENTEEEKRDYFATELSEDSEDDREAAYRKCYPEVQQNSARYSLKITNAIHLSKAKNILDSIIASHYCKKDGESAFHVNYKIRMSSTKDDDLKLLELLNNLKQEGDIKKHIHLFEDKFVIAQFRGITHLTTKWNQEQRRWHRNSSQIGQPIFSSAVHELADVPFQNKYSEEQIKSLMQHAPIINRSSLLRSRHFSLSPNAINPRANIC